MIPRDSIEWAYCILHQKLKVYEHSTIPSQKDEIEYLVARYAEQMNPELLACLSPGNPDFLHDHENFEADLRFSVDALEKMGQP